ncbi:hypothetical protein [Cupriavidus alkaliphilus]|uniref:hypothetical protein n=1 Tax=Cupriavidus alkaliphilus TaxID=942866 RepID=UPI00181A7B63|nr:hypothetical protein [Cupriavidus alkaliphilus]MBB2915849.1 hypothetical protein [Cupriavidus alkaliphilus]
MLDAITTAAGANAVLTVYNGTRPATGGSATTALAALTCSATLAPGAAGGVLTLNAISNAAATATGTATWARLTTSGGTFLIDLDVGTSGTDLVLNATGIVTGATVSVTAATITAGNA